MNKKVAILFPGQGSQYSGMGKQLYDRYNIFKKIFDEANDVLGFDLKRICFEGDENILKATENAQPAILTLSIGVFKILQNEFDIDIKYLAGHSLGEISALTCSNAIKFEDALKIVRKRGLLMKEIAGENLGGMVAVFNLDEEKIKNIFKEENGLKSLTISNFNAPTELVVSGEKKELEKFTVILSKRNVFFVPLKVSAAFHNPLMLEVAKKLGQELSKYKFNNFKKPVISNIDGLPYGNPDEIIEKLEKQIYMPVQWIKIMKFLEQNGINFVIEAGGKNILKKLSEKNTKVIKSVAFNEFEEPFEIKENFKKIDEKEIIKRVLNKCLLASVCTKNNNFDNDEYNKGVVQPYNSLQKLIKEIEDKKVEPEEKHINLGLKWMKKIFETKKVSAQEQKEWYKEISGELNKLKILSINFSKEMIL